MTTALTTIAPKLGKLIPLLASDKPGEVVATAAAITRTLKQAGADWHDLVKALGRAEPPGTRSSRCAGAISRTSEHAGWLAEMRVSRRLSPWEQRFLQPRSWRRCGFGRGARSRRSRSRILDRCISKIVAEAR